MKKALFLSSCETTMAEDDTDSAETFTPNNGSGGKLILVANSRNKQLMGFTRLNLKDLDDQNRIRQQYQCLVRALRGKSQPFFLKLSSIEQRSFPIGICLENRA